MNKFRYAMIEKSVEKNLYEDESNDITTAVC